MESNARWTAMAAVILSAGALGLSAWVAACQTQAPDPSHPEPIVSAAGVGCLLRPPCAGRRPGRARSFGCASCAVDERDALSSRLEALRVCPGAAAGEEARGRSRASKAASRWGLAGTFVLGADPIYAFVEVQNASPEDGAIVISFERAGVRAGNVNLAVPANQPRWRTWAWSKGVKEPGEWIAVVRSSGGRELARTAFEVTDS